jgi:AcrR family transcriptional regulator
VTKEPVPEAPSADASPTWRELAVARSLDSARTRAEVRVQRFLDAAMELMNENSGKDFTVQEVVERSGQSLRSFYQYFGGKHELLLALFEELVRSSAELLEKKVAAVDDPLEKLHVFVVEHYRMARPSVRTKGGPPPKSPTKGAPTTPVMVDFAQRLLTDHPAEAARAFAPVVALFNQILDAAADAGAIRPGLRNSFLSGTMLEAIMFNAFSTTIAGVSVRKEEDPAEELWDLFLHGVGVGVG